MVYLLKKARLLVCASLISLIGGIATATVYAEVCPCPTSEEVRALFRAENIEEHRSGYFMLKSPYIGYFSPAPIRWVPYKYDDLESYRNLNFVSKYEERSGFFNCSYSFADVRIKLSNEAGGCKP